MSQISRTTAAPATFVLVPGFWLGAWAWDQVAAPLRAAGHRVEAVTLPGLEDAGATRAGITLDDHIGAVAKVVEGLGPDVILVGHSGGGTVIYGVTDRMPDRIRRGVYVDSGPLGEGVALRADLDPGATECPLPSWAEFEAGGSSLEGLDEAMRSQFQRRAVPHPAGPARDGAHLTNPARRQVPVTLITCSFRPDQVAKLTAEGHPWFAELADLQVTRADLPTGHWPMWSRPADLAAAIAATAQA